MILEDIIRVLDYKMGSDIYKVARRMLEDNTSKNHLCSSIEDINKAQGICDWLEEKSKRKPSAKQLYVLKMFIACNLGFYGEITDNNSVSVIFNSL